MSSLLPQTAREWEKVLCRHFLMIGSNGDATPIRSLEITLATLTEACGRGVVSHAEVEAGFRSAFRHKSVVAPALERGEFLRLDHEGLPGCFTFLALTLYIDSLLDETYAEIGQYREKLDTWLGFGRSFSHLEGVAAMWEHLAGWLDRRVDAGEPFRRIILPPHGTWTHIGYTRRLSFPARRDVRLVERFLTDHPRSTQRPCDFIANFEATALGPHASWGLKQAYEEFRSAYLADSRALAGHRFWRFVTSLKGGERLAGPKPAAVEMSFDEDGGRIFVVAVGSVLDKPRTIAPTLGAAMEAVEAAGETSLAAALARGWLLFRQIGHGRWQSALNVDECVGRILLGCRSELAPRVEPLIGPLPPSGAWALLNEPTPTSVVENAIARLGGARRQGDWLVPVSVCDGVQSGDVWLGRPAFLPRIVADTSEFNIVPEPGNLSGPLTISDDGSSRLQACSPVDGAYVVSPKVARGRPTPWSRRISFVRDAVPHTAYGGSKDDLLPLRDWASLEKQGLTSHVSDSLAWEEGGCAIGDLLEAVYAGGRTGWDEMDLIEVIRLGVGGAVDAWTMLRSLHDAGYLCPRLRQHWKGRVWTLVPPSLLIVKGRETDIVLAEGALCDRLTDAFKRAAEGGGGAPFRRPAMSVWSPPTIGCASADPQYLAEKLGWPIAHTKDLAPPIPLAVETTPKRNDRYLVASQWDWEMRRFTVGRHVAEGSVALTRWQHPGGRDHDVYVVESPEHQSFHLSRTASIVLAHGLAHEAFVKIEDDRLVRVAREGGLPDVASMRLRVCNLRNAGPVDDTYVYPFCDLDAQWLHAIMPGCIGGGQEASTATVAEILALSRRSGARIRPLWIGGRMRINIR